MTCDDVELALVVGEGLSAEAKEHLAGCEKCSVFQVEAAQVVQDAALPPLSATEKASLSGLAPRVHHAWKQRDRQRGFVRRFAGLAVAACMGAAVASAALMPSLSQRALPNSTTSDDSEWALPSTELTAADTEDELDFEVSWPTPDTNTY
jgi:hypothetical protein